MHTGTTPGRAAYAGLLAVTSLGTISSTIMAPAINDISADTGAGDRGIVVAVAAFTVAMVLTSPVAGWLADRLGPKRYLIGSLVAMVAGQVLAGMSANLPVLVAARVVQGIACSGIPPCVQHLLAHHWPSRRRQSMAAWASAIGVGQAVGPPAGGAIAEVLHWRWVFGVTALIALLVLVVLTRSLPEAPVETATPVDLRALLLLTLGGGLVAIGLTALGQGVSHPPLQITVTGFLTLLVVLRPNRRPAVLGSIGREPGFRVATLSAAAALAVMGVTVVSVPIHLGSRLGLGPGLIGVSTVALAIGMMTFAPVAARLSVRIGTWGTLASGLIALTLLAPSLGVVETRGEDTAIIPLLMGILFGIGCGLATVQSMAALILVNVPGRTGAALGVHNMARFTGLCLGYAWLALAIPFGHPLLIHLGSAAFTLAALVVTARARRAINPAADASGRRARPSR